MQNRTAMKYPIQKKTKRENGQITDTANRKQVSGWYI